MLFISVTKYKFLVFVISVSITKNKLTKAALHKNVFSYMKTGWRNKVKSDTTRRFSIFFTPVMLK